jgi:hypothetical protein
MPSLGNKSRTNHKQRYLRFIKTDRGTSCRSGSAPLVGRLRLDFFGGLQVAKPFETAGKANPFRAEFGPTNPPAFLATCPQNNGPGPVSRHFQLPFVFAWNLTMERSLGQSFQLSQNYQKFGISIKVGDDAGKN